MISFHHYMMILDDLIGLRLDDLSGLRHAAYAVISRF